VQLVLEPQDSSIRSNYHNDGTHISSRPLERRPNNVSTDPVFEGSV
jgi:hypothetical protein